MTGDSGPDGPGAGDRRSSAGVGAALLAVGALAAVGSAVAYWLSAGTQVLGGLVALSLVAGGAGIVWWARSAMRHEVVVGDREPLASSGEDRRAFAEALAAGEQSIGRRWLLGGSLLALVGGLAAGAASLVRSLGPEPLPILNGTPWREGMRLVRDDGQPLTPEDLRIGGVLTVWPEGHTDAADAQTLLIHVRPGELELSEEQQAAAHEDFVAYSKICTHAACPVGLYQQEQRLLLCPCHQSTFDVLQAAAPTSGPATRPLPQLPIDVDEEGFLIAQGDFVTPVGPGYWNLR